MKQENFLEAGQLVTVFGVRGELKMQVWCDSAEFAKKIPTLYLDGAPLAVEQRRIHKDALLIKLKGVDTVEAARTYVGRILYFSKAENPLPRRSYYIDDLVGLKVFDRSTGTTLGTLTEVLQRPANDVYAVTDGEKEILIPAAGGFVEKVDLEAGIMTVNTIEGMLD